MGSFTQAMEQLNAAQKQAVTSVEGPLLVIAGPGTGKTQLLSMRAAYILQKTDATPANILCLTFTEAAARNMRERLTNLIGEAAYHVGIYTFHSFGTDIIQRYPEYFLEQPLLTAIDELTAHELLTSIFDQLPHSSPLAQKLGDDYLHLKATSATISWLKQAAIEPEQLRQTTSQNQAFITYCEPLLAPFSQSPSAKLLPDYQKLAQQIQAYPDFSSNSLAQLMHTELIAAIEETDPQGRYAKPITAWRNKWLIKTQVRTWVLADKKRTAFLQAVADVYEQYQSALAHKGWYTYDDMILRTITALQKHDELRFTLQEQYQYIMVDEYQDTNGSQNRLLELLADSPVNEGRPNLMVVGDDDQAIYRFQGAEMSLMLDFLQRWREPEQVVLTTNYRSGDTLLALSRQIVTQGEDRLEARIQEVSKELVSREPGKIPSTVTRLRSLSALDQYAEVAAEIAKRIQNGQDPQTIAVLAPKHSYLKELVPYLLDQNIPVSYERREHILNQPRIVELLELARLVQAAEQGKWQLVDALLPTILSANYWKLAPLELWQLSVEAHREKRYWLELMQNHQNVMLRNFAKSIPQLAQEATHASLESMLDYLLGNRAIALSDGEAWHIPYRQTYFAEEQLEHAPQEYFTLLGQLTSLREKLRDYQPGKSLNLNDFVLFVNLYEQSQLPLLDTNPHATSTNAVELMTAYKAKGLEWDTVFLLDCHNHVWGTSARSGTNSFGLPSNLAWIKPASDAHDDRLRLFYVALTRAKRDLYLTGYEQTLSGKSTEPVAWLTAEAVSLPPETHPPKPAISQLVRTQEIQWGIEPAQRASLQASLRPFLERYKLSATHLNDFIDVTKGGPRHFFFRHILHFPEAMAPSAVYGSAIHQALHHLHTAFSRTGTLPPLKNAQNIFENHITDSSLPANDKNRLLDRGIQALQHFYNECGSSFKATDKSEYGFASEGVIIDQARLTGKIDLIRQKDDRSLIIIDYKTGKPLSNWHPKQDYSQIRAHLYQQQLAFYQLMLNNSAHFSNQSIAETALQFVEPDENGKIVQLSYTISPQDTERLQRLITVIWEHIMNLDFPDTSQYSLNLKGVRAFENDLLDKKI